ncbi:hypothetical protein Syun_019362 [Stephania yunnanensis]|uniref:Uncharacterized protein n=1 Tax=Stephania yunnanensis TaxID=152371 RepID=A0AAP0IUR1_9MAGN
MLIVINLSKLIRQYSTVSLFRLSFLETSSCSLSLSAFSLSRLSLTVVPSLSTSLGLGSPLSPLTSLENLSVVDLKKRRSESFIKSLDRSSLSQSLDRSSLSQSLDRSSISLAESRIWATNSLISGLTRSGALTCLGMLETKPRSVRDFAILMADALSVIPTAVLRNLSDNSYEKRKIAAQKYGGDMSSAKATLESETRKLSISKVGVFAMENAG